MRITAKGQVTIPRHIRERLGLRPHTEVEIVIDGNDAVLRKKGALETIDQLMAPLRSGPKIQ